MLQYSSPLKAGRHQQVGVWAHIGLTCTSVVTPWLSQHRGWPYTTIAIIHEDRVFDSDKPEGVEQGNMYRYFM